MSQLRLVRDERVERAVEAMKSAPARRWTVADLAKVAGLSRAAFARRFRQERGAGPLSWLGEHRLQLARVRLFETTDPLADIAALVGYTCEFAFAKAFKRGVGVSPGVYRRTVRARRQLIRAA